MGGDNILESESGDGCVPVNILKTREFYAFRGQILRYVNYISIQTANKSTSIDDTKQL